MWLGNARGTTFSRAHKRYDPDTSSEYWNYSFHEIGKYDLPAMINFALDTLNQTTLHYIGHSQGCTSFFVMLSLRPEYNQKIKSMHALAPAVLLEHSTIIDKSILNSMYQIEV